MNRRTWLQAIPLAVLLPPSAAQAMERVLSQVASGDLTAEEREQGGAMAEPSKVYELRIYHAASGKLNDLLARFRDHTDALFTKHGMKNLAYWTALDEPTKSSTLFYILEHPSREAAAANWKAFQADPEWQAVKAKSEENGKLVDSIDSTYLTLTGFSKRPA